MLDSEPDGLAALTAYVQQEHTHTHTHTRALLVLFILLSEMHIGLHDPAFLICVHQ